MVQSFDAELEQLVSKMARDLAREITALILKRLGIAGSRGLGESPPGASKAAGRRGRGTRRAGAAGDGRDATRVRSTAEQRARVVEQVERVIAGSNGLSLGEIEKKAALRRSSVAAALKALKDQGRTFMGGTKRFARYASTQAQADRASLEARRAGGDR
jgi:hypothetical protein